MNRPVRPSAFPVRQLLAPRAPAGRPVLRPVARAAHGLCGLLLTTGAALAQTPPTSPAGDGAAAAVPASADSATSAASAASAAALRPEATARLQALKVKARREAADDLPPAQAGGMAATGARLGLLGNQDVRDTPFAVTSYTAQLIEDQQARTVADVLQNDPSVRFTTSGGHTQENYRLRGFDVHNSDVAFNGQYGLAPLGSSTLEFVERVEVLRGPSAMFTGMAPSGGIGGVVNLVPKRAGDTPLARVRLSHETGSQLGTALDLGRRFGEDQAFGVRVNAAYSDGGTPLQGQDRTRRLLSAALDYRKAGLTASLDLYDSQQSFAGGTPAMYGFATANLPAVPDPSINVLKGAAGRFSNQGAVARAEYAFNAGLSAFASVGARRYTHQGFISGTHAHSVQADGSAQVRGVAQRAYDDSETAELGARLNLQTGPVRHALVVQASRLGLEAGSLVNVTAMQASNIYTPVTPTLPAMPTGDIPRTSQATLSSLALVDTMSLLQDRLSVTLGLREQQVKQLNYDERALTPALGVVVKPWGESISLYGNHVQGLSQGGTVSDVNATNHGHQFAPYKTTQQELGLKWQAGPMLHTASVFQIEVPTMMSTGPSSSPTYTDGAETRMRGLEWSSSGALTPVLHVVGGASWLHSALTATQGGVNQGKEAFGVPRWQGNLALQWATPVPGLQLQARGVATSSVYLNNANTWQLPGWGRLDLGASYDTRVAARKLVLRLNVDNVLDRHYWSGSFAETRATLAEGRVIRTSATMDF
ncbi:MAG: hypothetical protein RL223_640 [Pseudomonadota bacterium]